MLADPLHDVDAARPRSARPSAARSSASIGSRVKSILMPVAFSKAGATSSTMAVSATGRCRRHRPACPAWPAPRMRVAAAAPRQRGLQQLAAVPSVHDHPPVFIPLTAPDDRPGDEMALCREREQDHRQDDQHAGCGHAAPVDAGITAGKRRHQHRQRAGGVVGQHRGEQEVVPGELQAQDAGGDQARA